VAANRPRSRPALARLVWVLALAHTAAGLTCALSLERPSCLSSLATNGHERGPAKGGG
jgi:hypothetical protein